MIYCQSTMKKNRDINAQYDVMIGGHDMGQVVLLTGGSAGIGLQTAIALQQAGYEVYEISRNHVQTPGVVHITGDVTDDESVETAVNKVLQAAGRIDILINNAGFGISGAVEFTDTQAAMSQFDVNFFGMVRMCRAVLPYMRKAGNGKIINLSSVAATIPIPFQTFYSASKAAINAYTMALANEVRPYHIHVCAVMPGDIHTHFTTARKKMVTGDAAYDERLCRSVAKMEKDEQNGMDPKTVAHVLVRIAKKKRTKPLFTIRWDYRLFVLLSKLLPARLLNILIYQLYAK